MCSTFEGKVFPGGEYFGYCVCEKFLTISARCYAWSRVAEEGGYLEDWLGHQCKDIP
jgi:hypothetical protein